ncbi:hypothetical protein H4R21_000380 [Coemansia helicoidea]|uniref:Uncharacterized protein n=1 Tax=Coemansia helicoidea TaxID=1286919 RepID=A0ACC1LGP4_9FUNG|nr:hypothetical protein H4R21_000380 [Coemansia helicoidea]
MVYNYVLVECGDYLEFGEDERYHARLLEAPRDDFLKTNLDLVAMVGRARAVKRAQIDVYCLDDPFPWLQDAIQRMRAVASKWRAVELMVVTYSNPYEFIRSDRAVDQFADDVAETCDALTALMPDVNRLKCWGSCSNAIAQLLYGHLASHYAKQLLWFDSDDMIIAPPGCRFAGLRRLTLNHHSLAGHQFPQIASGELVSLNLSGVLASQSWTPFSTDDDSWVIEFTNLKSLYEVYYDSRPDDDGTVRHRDGHPWELHFPNLKSLYISSDEEICPLLEYAVLPPRMESITIQMLSAAYKDIEDVVLPETKHISLCIDMESREDTSGLIAISRLLEDVHGCETLKLKIEDYCLEVKPEDLTYTALTHLESYATTDVASMLAIIDRLPNLVELKLYSLDWAELGPEDLDYDAYDNATVKPIHSSLQTLGIDFDSDERCPAMEVRLVQYLLLRISTLTELIARSTPKTPVTSFVEAYAPRYPHLLSVNLALKEIADLPESEPESDYSE